MIDWITTQKRIGARVDGQPGRETYGKLILRAAYDDRPTEQNVERLAQGMAKYAPVYGADKSPERLAESLAEMEHECGGFMRFEENLNYSAARLAQIWPNRYAIDPKAKIKDPNAKAKELAHRPEAIANATYGLRMGNLAGVADNDENPDGWQYRGRGPTQLTFKGNYEEASQVVGLDLVKFPDLAADPFTGVLIALAFYKRNGVFRAVDRGDFTAARIAVNGGIIGLQQIGITRRRLLDVIAVAA